MTHSDPFKVVAAEGGAPKPKLYTIETSLGMPDWQFTGLLLGEVSTRRTARFARWTEMTLYRVTEGPNTGHYVLEVVGCSDVFHQVDGRNKDGKPCKGALTGDRLPSDTLQDTAVPCPECLPGGVDVPWPETVVAEVDRPQVSECPTAADVLAKLRDGSQGRVSNPAQALLSQASSRDSDMNSALNEVRAL